MRPLVTIALNLAQQTQCPNLRKCAPSSKVAQSQAWDSLVADEKTMTWILHKKKRKRGKALNLFKKTGRERKLSAKLSLRFTTQIYFSVIIAHKIFSTLQLLESCSRLGLHNQLKYVLAIISRFVPRTQLKRISNRIIILEKTKNYQKIPCNTIRLGKLTLTKCRRKSINQKVLEPNTYFTAGVPLDTVTFQPGERDYCRSIQDFATSETFGDKNFLSNIIF